MKAGKIYITNIYRNSCNTFFSIFIVKEVNQAIVFNLVIQKELY